MDDELIIIFDEVKCLLSKMTGVKDDEIFIHSSIQADLGIWGDDASEFLIAYSEKFNVNLTSFLFNDYFLPEGAHIFSRLFNIFPHKSLTVKHLVKGVIARRLDEDVINSDG